MRSLNGVELFHICAADTENSEAWAEFLSRYAAKIKYFISGTLRQISGSTSMIACGIQDSDLFQDAIIRLVQNDCAAMKRFSGNNEGEMLAYLAVICRSTVMDTLRRTGANKRALNRDGKSDFESVLMNVSSRNDFLEFDRPVLLREIMSLAKESINEDSGSTSSRDQLVFYLHFFHGLSLNQIAQCKGIRLTKAGVEKLLKRVISRVQTHITAERQNETGL